MKTMRVLRDERGNILVLTAMSMAALVGIMALAIDIGNLYYTQRQLQTLADAAAIAGALEVTACSGSSNCAVMQAAAKSALTEGGSTTPTVFQQCATASGSGLLLTINNSPCALGASDPNNGNINYVEAVVTKNVPTYFGGYLGISTFKISARAEAGAATPVASGNGPCILTTGTMTLQGGTGGITDAAGTTCGITVDSSSSSAVSSNSGKVTVSYFDVVGKVQNSGATITPSPTTGVTAVADPFLAEINNGTLSTPAEGTTQAVSTVGGTTTLQPGYYPNGINFNGSGYTVTLDPGVYYMGGSLNIGDITVTGTGVTLYMANGTLQPNSSATVNLTAPTTGPTAGLVVWQPASNTSGMDLDTGSNLSFGGGIYLPGATLTLNSGSGVSAMGMIVAQSLILDSGASITLSCSSMPGGVCPGGGSGGKANGSTSIVLAE
jgi:Flp pilus assembly protein TadG